MPQVRFKCLTTGKIITIREEDGELFFAHGFDEDAEPDFEHIFNRRFEDLVKYYGRTMVKF